MKPSYGKGGIRGLTTRLTQKPGAVRAAVLVLVTDQMSCDRLIVAGRALADREGLALQVVNVSRLGSVPSPEAMEHLYQVSREHGAVMRAEYSENPEKTIVGLLKDQSPAHVVTGLPGKGGTLLQRLWTRFGALSFHMVAEDGSMREVTEYHRATIT